MTENIGAPERIRTSDPQIRRLEPSLGFQQDSCKPAHFAPELNQGLNDRAANHFWPLGLPSEDPEELAFVSGDELRTVSIYDHSNPVPDKP